MLLWVEPWDQYLTTTALVATSGYANVGLSGTNAPGRTGTQAAWIFNSGFTRKAMDAPATTLGQGSAWRLNGAVGGSNYQNGGFRFESAGPLYEASVVALPNLGIGVYDRTGTLVGQTRPNLLFINSYVWVEAKCIKNTAGVNTGQVIVKVNGQLEVTVNGINLPNSFEYFAIGAAANTEIFMDDWIVWDNSGAVNNDFMGDRRLFVSYPDANLALQDFTPTPAGNAWDRINDAPPNDAAYIAGAAAGNISEFTKQGIGINSTDIAAVVAIARMFKSDAGVASGRVGLKSNATVVNSAAYFPGTTGSYTRLIQELDPNGAIPWTKAAADAAAIRVTRDS